MASLVENIWRMKVDEERQPREERLPEQRAEKLCGRHLEKLHYYCKDDQQMLCVMCREFPRAQAPHCCSPGEGCPALSGKNLVGPHSVLIANKVLPFL
jgi:hypothetical protein